MRKKFILKFFSFFAGVVTPLINIHSRISSWIFEKIWNGPNGILRGLGDTDLWKKIWCWKSRVRLPLINVLKTCTPLWRTMQRPRVHRNENAGLRSLLEAWKVRDQHFPGSGKSVNHIFSILNNLIFCCLHTACFKDSIVVCCTLTTFTIFTTVLCMFTFFSCKNIILVYNTYMQWIKLQVVCRHRFCCSCWCFYVNYGQSLSSTSWNQNQVTQLFLTLTRGNKTRKSLAISSGLILQKEIMVRKLIFYLCLPQYITVDLDPNSSPKKGYLQYIMLINYFPKKRGQTWG